MNDEEEKKPTPQLFDGLCSLSYVHNMKCMMECFVHFGRMCLHDIMIQIHELNIENMQMPQVLQFMSAYSNDSTAFQLCL